MSLELQLPDSQIVDVKSMGKSYVERSVGLAGLKFSRLALETAHFERFVSLMPCGFTPGSANFLMEGSIRHSGFEHWTISPSDVLATVVAESLRRLGGSFIIESQLERPDDPAFNNDGHSSPNVFFYGQDVYYFVSGDQRDLMKSVRQAILSAEDATHHTHALLTDEAIDLSAGPLLDTAAFRHLASKSRAIAAACCQSESFVFGLDEKCTGLSTQ